MGCKMRYLESELLSRQYLRRAAFPPVGTRTFWPPYYLVIEILHSDITPSEWHEIVPLVSFHRVKQLCFSQIKHFQLRVR